MITEKAASIASATTGVIAPITGQFFQAFELKLIATLLGVISILMSIILKFMWDMRKDNRADHKLLFGKQDSMNERLAHLEGEHNSSMNAQGCAYDPDRLQKMVNNAVSSVFQDRKHNCRESDCDNCLDGSEARP